MRIYARSVHCWTLQTRIFLPLTVSIFYTVRPGKAKFVVVKYIFFSKIDARIFVTPGRVLPTRGRCVCVSLPAVARTGAFDPIRLYRSLYTIPGQVLQNFTAQGQLLWNANRKPHPSFPLNDPSYFKVTSLFDADLINGTIYIVTMKY